MYVTDHGTIRYEGDEVKALAQDRAWIARFEIVDSVAGRVIARLAQVIEGAPRLSAAGAPKPLPEGYRIERLKPGDQRGLGYVVIREKDGVEFANSGMPWRDYQSAYEGILKHAIFQTDKSARYVP